ncbi:MAG: N-glycosylase/DNA lyase [Candidatus Zixiibacteriota bacterium]
MANYNQNEIAKLSSIRKEIQNQLDSRLQEFRDVWKRFDKEEIFCEFTFCLMTPQSKARSCQAALESLIDKGLLKDGSKEEIARDINIVRFRNNKAGYIVEAREKYNSQAKKSLRDILAEIAEPVMMRKWLVENVKGMGFKEGSHFLRNIGFGDNLAILDRHILKNLVKLNIIKEIPKSLSPKRYIAIEAKMRKFSSTVDIPMDELDLILWYSEAGEIFK